MKKYTGLYVVIVISTLIFILSGCSENKNVSKLENGADADFNSLIEKAISVQYGEKDIKKTDIFSKNYIKKIPEDKNFYKDELKPYEILRSNLEELENKTGDNLVVSVRISDTNGEYIQVLHMIKINGRYYIDNIEYDI